MEAYEILIAVTVMTLIFLSLVWLVFHKCKTMITHPSTTWPLLGHLGPFMFTKLGIHDYATSMLAQCGYTVELQGPSFTNIAAILTSDPDNIRYILSSNASNFNKGESFKSIFEMWGDGIMVAEDDSWKFQRRLNGSLLKQNGFLRLVEKSVHTKLEAGMFPLLDLASKLGFEVDLQDVFQRFTMDIICKLLLGVDINSLSIISLSEVQFSKAFETTSKAMFARHLKPERVWRLQRWIGLGLEGRAKKAEAVINDFIYEQILSKCKRIQKYVQEDTDDGFDMLSSFMKVEDHQAALMQTLTEHDKFLRDSIMNMLTAGRSPTSTALTWFFLLVATHPHVEEKLRQELNEATTTELQLEENETTFQLINKLVYLHAAIYETLRLYPSSPFNHRVPIKADTLPSGHRVRKGMKILISVYSQGRMEKMWGGDCLEFKPERWISDKGEIVQVGYNKFTAFGSGPRYCMGRDVALMEMKMAIASIIRNYRFKMVEGQHIVPASSTVMYMKHGLKVHVTKINVA